jgi:hypothetical protein
MRASRILAFARTIRCASVGAAVRKARADLLGGQPADFAKGQRDLSIRRQGRMAAGEDQAEPIVLDILALARRRASRLRLEALGQLRL